MFSTGLVYYIVPNYFYFIILFVKTSSKETTVSVPDILLGLVG